LNHAALTLEALAAQYVRCAGLVIGSWPQEPGVVETGNRDVLLAMSPLRAVLPSGAGALGPVQFDSMSSAAFDPQWVKSLAA
jgi:dethiobiotin synthetase